MPPSNPWAQHWDVPAVLGCPCPGELGLWGRFHGGHREAEILGLSARAPCTSLGAPGPDPLVSAPRWHRAGQCEHGDTFGVGTVGSAVPQAPSLASPSRGPGASSRLCGVFLAVTCVTSAATAARGGGGGAGSPPATPAAAFALRLAGVQHHRSARCHRRGPAAPAPPAPHAGKGHPGVVFGVWGNIKAQTERFGHAFSPTLGPSVGRAIFRWE